MVDQSCVINTFPKALTLVSFIMKGKWYLLEENLFIIDIRLISFGNVVVGDLGEMGIRSNSRIIFGSSG